ncbi:hypothetical protein IMY05_009G0000400 [Salix suchowensis]|nr:hypothetical protein IMY05_009G0000400 [Salix suchowensis]
MVLSISRLLEDSLAFVGGGVTIIYEIGPELVVFVREETSKVIHWFVECVRSRHTGWLPFSECVESRLLRDLGRVGFGAEVAINITFTTPNRLPFILNINSDGFSREKAFDVKWCPTIVATKLSACLDYRGKGKEKGGEGIVLQCIAYDKGVVRDYDWGGLRPIKLKKGVLAYRAGFNFAIVEV